MSRPSFVIVGAGQAGGWAAVTLRSEGFQGQVTLVGEETYPPYERPPLSKEVLLGEKLPRETYLWSLEQFQESDIELRLGERVERIDRARKSLMFAGGETLRYDRLLLATGSTVRELVVPGAQLPGIHYLRAIPDTEMIGGSFASGGSLLIVGGGWIGLEVASAARKRDLAVTVVEATDRLCGRAVSPELSQFLRVVHEANGVEVRCDCAVASFRVEGPEKVAVLNDGSEVNFRTAVIGIGVTPDTELAESAGLQVDNGIVVDEYCRTSDPDIFAAGDVTSHPHPRLGRRVRLESWENAQNQGIEAAKSMLDKGEPYLQTPWFWSDQYDLNIQLVGLPDAWELPVVRGSIESHRFTLFYLSQGRLDGAAGVNSGRDVRIAKKIIERQIAVSPVQLADESLKLQSLLRT